MRRAIGPLMYHPRPVAPSRHASRSRRSTRPSATSPATPRGSAPRPSGRAPPAPRSSSSPSSRSAATRRATSSTSPSSSTARGARSPSSPRPAEWSRGVALVVGFPEAAPGAPAARRLQLRRADRRRPRRRGRAQVAPADLRRLRRDPLLPPGRPLHRRGRGAFPSGSASPSARTSGTTSASGTARATRAIRSRSSRGPAPRLVVNISASPYAIGKPALRERMLAASARGPRRADRLREPGGRERRARLRRRLDARRARRRASSRARRSSRRRSSSRTSTGGDAQVLGLDGAPLPPRARGRAGPARRRGALGARPRGPRLRPQVRLPRRGRGALRRHRLRAHRLHRRRGARAGRGPRRRDAVALQLGALARGRRRARAEPRHPLPGDLRSSRCTPPSSRSSSGRRGGRSATSPSRTCRRASAGRS